MTSQDAFIVSTDQHAYAELGARWLFETLGGKGDVAYMRGIDGVGADTLRDEGFQAALSEYPDISIVSEVFTDWSPRTGAQQALEIITTQPVDGIWTSGIDYSVVEQFQVAGLPYVPIVGADNNAFIGQLLNIDGLEGVAVSNPPSIGGVATALALRELQGEDIDQWNLIEPVVLNTRRELSGVFHDYLPSGWSSYMVIEPCVSYTADQVLACTGPGE